MHSPSVLYAIEPKSSLEGLYTKAPLFTILYGFKLTPLGSPLGDVKIPSLLTPTINSVPYFHLYCL